MSTKVVIMRKADDFVLRVSLGGTSGVGYYCVYRGKREQVIECLGEVLAVLVNMPEQPIEAEQ